jgi:hypothetical protein
MVQIGNYNYSDYYSSGAHAPREGTLSYAEFDPEAYLAARSCRSSKSVGLQVRVSTSLPACSCSSMVERLPAMKHYMRIIKVYTLVTPSNSYQDNTSNRPLIHFPQIRIRRINNPRISDCSEYRGPIRDRYISIPRSRY